MTLHSESKLDIRLREAATQTVSGRILHMARRYDRAGALASLRAPARLGAAHDRQVVRWLKKALRNERSKALTGHWSYDANRHLMLKAALKCELAKDAGPH
ncbi:MAG: hypothetical protein KDE63_08460 [Novosphingobium sp.]|nr:hypothetical protein [Novosphingobium sp.]